MMVKFKILINLIGIVLLFGCDFNSKNPETDFKVNNREHVNLDSLLETQNTNYEIIEGTPTYHRIIRDTAVSTSFKLKFELLRVKNSDFDSVYFNVGKNTLLIKHSHLHSGDCPNYLTQYEIEDNTIKIWTPMLVRVDTSRFREFNELSRQVCGLTNFIEVMSELRFENRKIPDTIYYKGKKLR